MPKNIQRRDFIKMGAIGAAAGIIMPKSLFAMESKGFVIPPAFLGNLIFTEDHQGRWQGAYKEHLPQIEHNGGVMQVTTNHDMFDVHYIVKHMIFDENFQFIEETAFTPGGEEQPVSEHDLKERSGRLYVLSVCNIHDNWLSSIDV